MISKLKLTIIGFFVSMAVLVPNLIFDLELYRRYTSFLSGGDLSFIGEIVLSATILLVFVVFDVYRRIRKETVENEKLKIYKAMMFSHHHIINNFLNQALLFKLTAEDTPGFDQEVLEQYDKIADQAQELVKAVGSIDEISEDSIIESISPKSTDSNTEYEWEN